MIKWNFKKSSLLIWHLKKLFITLLLVISSVIVIIFCRDGYRLLIIPIIYIIWLIGEKIYVCPHCKNSINIQLHISKNTRCHHCGKKLND